MENIIIGSISGCLAITVCHPIDVIRTQMQVHSIGFTACTKEIIANQGFKGFYRGFASPFVAQGIYKAVIFSTNKFTQKYVFRSSPSSSALFGAGVIAGTVNSFVVAPVEIIRTHQIFATRGPEGKNLSLLACAKNIIDSRGIQGLWRGLLPTVLRDGPGLGLYFLTFERFKIILSKKFQSGSSVQSSVPHVARIAAGALAGASFWIVALPVDTIKTVIESQTSMAYANRDSLVSAGPLRLVLIVTRQLLAEGGIYRLYKAWPVALGRGLPAAAITLTSFDLMSDYVNQNR